MKKRNSIKKLFIILFSGILIIVLSITIFRYIKSQPHLNYTYCNTARTIVSYPDTNFAVISDLHYYDTSLGISGSAYEENINTDRKLLADSSFIFNFIINRLADSGVDFVLVTGDMTKDGELQCHQKVAAGLKTLTERGIKVCVIPGNHDIRNPASVKYEGSDTISVPNISADDFVKLYNDFGYKGALYRDKNTLSYVTEPVEGLWVIALDTCRYRDNKPGENLISSGILLQSQVDWLKGIFEKATEAGKSVIVLQHHGVIEHWSGQRKMYKDFLITDYRNVGEMLASYGVRIAFTGHYHSQDIALADFEDNGRLYDIETGSVITPPCPVRYCSITDNKLVLRSESLIDKLHPGTDYSEKSYQLIFNNLNSFTTHMLDKAKVPKADADIIAGQLSLAYLAHMYGDENIAKKPAFDSKKLGLYGRIIFALQKSTLDGLWNDLEPGDNECTIDLIR